MTFINSTNNYATSRFIVSSVEGQGNYTNIGDALTAASSGDAIFIMPGTYTTDLTLKNGVNFSCWVGSGEFGVSNVTIIGKATDSGASIACSFQNITFQTNNDYIIELTGDTSSIQYLSCNFLCDGNEAVSMNSTSQNVYWYSCYCDISSGATSFFNMTLGDFWIYNSQIDNSAGSTTAPTFSNGLLFAFGSEFGCPLAGSGSAIFEMSNCLINTSALNTTCLTLSETSSGTSNYGFFSSGTASAISLLDDSVLTVNYPSIASSNTYYIT